MAWPELSSWPPLLSSWATSTGKTWSKPLHLAWPLPGLSMEGVGITWLTNTALKCDLLISIGSLAHWQTLLICACVVSSAAAQQRKSYQENQQCQVYQICGSQRHLCVRRMYKSQESGLFEYATSKIMKLMLSRELNKRLKVRIKSMLFDCLLPILYCLSH